MSGYQNDVEFRQKVPLGLSIVASLGIIAPLVSHELILSDQTVITGLFCEAISTYLSEDKNDRPNHLSR